MSRQSLQARSLLRSHGATDPWFVATWGLNLYRGCAHGCTYCDGRAEKYSAAEDFEHEIAVKRNAPDLLDSELGRLSEPGFLALAGGVSDAYQPAERTECLARRVLEIAIAHARPVHVLTKSSLVERDFDLLKRLAEGPGAVLSCSIQSTDESVVRHFEPGTATAESRFQLLDAAHSLGIATSVMAIPVLPGISDSTSHMARLLERAAAARVDFLCLGGLTLRPGRQQEAYLQSLSTLNGELVTPTRQLFRRQFASGTPEPRYIGELYARYRQALDHCPLPGRMPHRLFRGKLPLYSEVAVLMEHEAFRRRLANHWVDHEGLEQQGWALQQWAKARRAQARRRRRWNYCSLEDEFLERLASGDLARTLSWPSTTTGTVQRLVARCGRPAPRQMSLKGLGTVSPTDAREQ